jgi:hypothetical protein
MPYKRLVEQTVPWGLGKVVLGICNTSCNMGEAAGARVGRALQQEVSGGLSMCTLVFLPRPCC